jgi:transcriptional regulator GlxA family with amidase domain
MQCRSPETLIVLGGYSDKWDNSDEDLKRLRFACHSARRTLFIGNGLFLAGHIGALNGCHVAVHPNLIEAFAEYYFGANVVDDSAWVDGRFASASGGIAAIRAGLEFVGADMGDVIGQATKNYL